MTAAICIDCGGYKNGPFAHCPQCGFVPHSGPDLLLSYTASAITLTPLKFHACAADIKNGLRPHLTPHEVRQLSPYINRCADLAADEREKSGQADEPLALEATTGFGPSAPMEPGFDEGSLRSELMSCRRSILEIEHELAGTHVPDASGSRSCDVREIEARLSFIHARLSTVEHQTRARFYSDDRELRRYLVALTGFTEATRHLCQILAEIDAGAWHSSLTVARLRRKRKAAKKDFVETEPLLDAFERHSIAVRLRPSFPS